jgi:hypothetical protein
MPQGCHGRPDARPPARTEQIVSALELKLDALKEDVNEYWRLDAAFARIAVAKRWRLHAPAWPRASNEKEEEIS